jgi:hypothetical protein
MSHGPTAILDALESVAVFVQVSGLATTVVLSRQPLAVSVARFLAGSVGIQVAADIRSATVALRFSPDSDPIVTGTA